MGAAFRTLRKRYDLTQSDFEPSSKSTVSDFERGEEPVSMPIFEAWCKKGGFTAFDVCALALKEVVSSPDASPIDNLSELGRLPGGEPMITADNKGAVIRFVGVLEDIPKAEYKAFAVAVARLAEKWPERSRRKTSQRRAVP